MECLVDLIPQADHQVVLDNPVVALTARWNISTTNAQLSNIRKDLDEMMGLIQRLLKNPLKQHLGAGSISPYHQESREQPPSHQYLLQMPYSTPLVEPQYLLQSTQAQHPSGLLYPSVLRGYTSDMDHTANFGRGQSMDKGQKNKQGEFSGYESDGNSAASEVLPMQSYRKEFSWSQSLQLAPGDKNELQKTLQPFSRSWEGIRTDLHA